VAARPLYLFVGLKTSQHSTIRQKFYISDEFVGQYVPLVVKFHVLITQRLYATMTGEWSSILQDPLNQRMNIIV